MLLEWSTLAALMPALGMTLAIVAIWIVQGFGFVHLFAPSAKQRPLLHLVFAAWCGLIANLLVSVTLYFAIPGVTIGQLAWPLTIVLAVASLALTVTRGRPQFSFDLYTVFVGVSVLVAIALVLRPLVDQTHLGFFESYNGEFANYAAMADVAQFHDAAFKNGGFEMQSREGVAGIACATISVITQKPAMWIVEPYAAALAGVAFTSLGVLFQQVLERRQAGKLATAIGCFIYLALIWSAASTFFWTASFISQFLSIAIWLPTLLLLSERSGDDRTTTIVLGIAFGALLVAYWEMLLPNLALLGAFQFMRASRGTRKRALASFGTAVVIALLVANRFSFEFLGKSTTVSTAGWDMFGDHRMVLRFAANVLGFTSAYHEPAPFSRFTVIVVLAGLASSAVYGAIRAWRESDAVIRGLLHLGTLFCFGLALAFALVIKRGGTNYVVTKVLVGYGWLAYVLLAVAAIDLASWLARRRANLAAIPMVFAAVLIASVSLGAYRFARIQHRVPLYLVSDGDALRAELHGRLPFVAGEQYSTEIVGRFLIHDRDLFAADPAWPGFRKTVPPAGHPVLVVGDGKLSSVEGITGNYLPFWWRGKLLLFEAR